MQTRVPADLHAWLKMQAIREGTTLAHLVTKIAREYQNKVEGGDQE